MDVRFRLGTALAAAAWMLFGCGGGGGGSPPPPSPPPPPPPPALFADVTAAAAIQFQYGMTAPAFPPGPEVDVDDSTFGGVASGDCDNDGDIDLFVTYSDVRPNRLYRNQRVPAGNSTFADTAAASGVAFTRNAGASQNWRHSGPVFADFEGDGDLDLFLGALYGDPVKLYTNDGSCNFTDISGSSGLSNLLADYTFSAGFGDYDLDGDLDIFMSHWGTPDTAYANRATSSELLFENLFDSTGMIQFQNVSTASNLTAITHQTRSWGTVGARCLRFVQAGFQNYDFIFTGTFAHLNGDIWPDLLLVGDFTTTQVLLNNGDANSDGIHDGFRDASVADLCNAQQPMGSALGDVDNDGDLDWFTTSIMGEGAQAPLAIGNRFYRNLGENGAGNVDMDDVTGAMGVASGGWGWGACFLDIDSDTDLDIFHTNGWYVSGALVANYSIDPSRVFISNGTSYTEQGATYGLNDTQSGRGVVCADFDNDGDLDIFQTTNNQVNSGLLRENRTAASGRNYLKVRLQGLAPNAEAVGARIFVTITSGGATYMREIMVGSDNYTSQNPTVQHFGLGAAAAVQQVRIVWPARGGGTVQSPDSVLNMVSANQTLSCDQANAPAC